MGLGRAEAKPEGGTVRMDPLSTGSDKPSKTKWVELCYDPDDDYDKMFVGQVVSMLSDKSREESEAIIRRLAYLYCGELE